MDNHHGGGTPVADISRPEPASASPLLEATDDEGFLGVIVPKQAIVLATKTMGTVGRVTRRVGESVRQGEVLVEMDSNSVTQELIIAQGAVKAAESGRRSSEADLALASNQLERARALGDLVSGRELTTAEYGVTKAQAVLDAANAGVEQARARVKQLENELADCLLRAPIDGTVTAQYYQAHSVVSPGSPILQLADTQGNWVRFAVPEAKASGLAIGTPVQAHLRNGGDIISGIVLRIAPEIDSASEMLFMEARLEAPAPTRDRPLLGEVVRVLPQLAGVRSPRQHR